MKNKSFKSLIAICLFLLPELNHAQGVTAAYNTSNAPVTPIDLLYFSAQKQDNSVKIYWATASEPPNAQLELEKSFNARDFVTIALFKDFQTKDKGVYSFSDNTPFKNSDNVGFNNVYYRLKQIDALHIFEYSKVIGVTKISTENLSLIPNAYQITAKSVKPFEAFAVTNLVGETVMKGHYNPATTVDISKLPSGFYCLTIQEVKMKFFK